jgi:hypothetical protein
MTRSVETVRYRCEWCLSYSGECVKAGKATGNSFVPPPGWWALQHPYQEAEHACPECVTAHGERFWRLVGRRAWWSDGSTMLPIYMENGILVPRRSDA